MEKAVSFLESRRYGAMLDATSEFNKMEGIAEDSKAYIAISCILFYDECYNTKTLPVTCTGSVYQSPINLKNSTSSCSGRIGLLKKYPWPIGQSNSARR